MKLSQTEHKIKTKFANREIQPSAKLWDNIQSELDNTQKSKPKVLWIKIAGVAAVLCLSFFAYQGFQNTREPIPTIVLDQKGAIEQPLEFKVQTVDYYVLTKSNEIKNNPTSVQATKKPITKIKESIADASAVNQSNSTIEDEVQSLLENAKHNLTRAEQEKLLVAEVDNLLKQAIENTGDTEQKEIIKSMQARLLLAEVESGIELDKPPNLKDKIWEAIVSNYTDLKNSVVLN